MTQSPNVFMLQLNKEATKVPALLCRSIGTNEYKGHVPAAAEAVYALSTQTGDRTKRG